VKFNSSFSLLEIFIVIAIVLTLVSISVSRFSFFNSFIVKNEVDRLFNAFSFLQQKAMLSNMEQKLIFDLDDNSYYYFSNDKKVFHKLCDVVRFGFLKGTYGPPSDPSKAIKHSITFKKEQQNKYVASITPDGKIDAGTVYFVDKDYKLLMALTCPISQLSYIRKYRYFRNKWVVI